MKIVNLTNKPTIYLDIEINGNVEYFRRTEMYCWEQLYRKQYEPLYGEYVGKLESLYQEYIKNNL